ncbi:MAG TPA: hypothetical protein PLM98_11605 [Thiolinea sp.]|nr:hypothetical protein [Thiolinea sp.]
MSELETIVATLGVERSASLFHSILPLISIRRYELLECLHSQDWDGAAHYAHNLLATGHLLSSKTLLDQLILIEKHELAAIQEPNFINQLTDELDTSLQQLARYSKTITRS